MRVIGPGPERRPGARPSRTDRRRTSSWAVPPGRPSIAASSRGVGSGPGFRAYITAHTVTWLPGKTRVVIPYSKYRTWARNLDAYPMLTRGDRRRLAVRSDSR